MSEEQIIQFLQDNVDYMINNDIILWLFRTIGWGLAKMLASLVGIGKTLYDFTFRLVDVTSWSGMEDWVNEFRPLIMTIMTASLVVLGMMYMFGKNKKHNLMNSILMFAVIATSSTFLFSTFNDWTIAFKDAVVNGEGVADGTALINANLYDLLYIDGEIGLKNMGDDNRPQYSSMTDSEVDYIKITEVLDWDDVENSDTKDILKKKLQFRTGGTSILSNVYNGVAWTSIGNDMYFRYKFNFGTYFLDTLAVLLIYFCLSYKNVRISYELLVGRILVTLKSADISTQKKLVKILESIKDQYLALCFTAVTIRSYFIFTDYIKETSGSNGIMRGIVTLFIAFCVIDGSNIMQRITGVDAGLSSMTGKIIAGSHMVQGAVGAINQGRMLHAMKQNSSGSSGTKNTADKNAKGSAEGSRGGAAQFGHRDSGNDMDKDLEKPETSAGQTAGGNSGEANGKMDQAGHPEYTDASGTAHDMDQDLGSESHQPMDDSMSGNTSGQMDKMEEELNRKEREQGQPKSATQGNKAGAENQEARQNRTNPEGSMFEKWGGKQSQTEQAGAGKSSFSEGAYTEEKHAIGRQDGSQEKQPFRNQEPTQRRESHRTEQPKAYGAASPAQTQSTGRMGGIKTSEGRTARATEERRGRDRYVGGEAVPPTPRKKRKGK